MYASSGNDESDEALFLMALLHKNKQYTLQNANLEFLYIYLYISVKNYCMYIYKYISVGNNESDEAPFLRWRSCKKYKIQNSYLDFLCK